MAHLIIAVIAIALYAAMSVTSMNYIPAGTAYKKEVKAFVTSGAEALKGAAEEYYTNNAALADETSDLTPGYVLIPPAPNGLAWSVGSGAYDLTFNGTYACLSGSITAPQFEGIQASLGYFSPQAYAISDVCGTQVASHDPGPYASTPSALTIWLQLDGP